MLEQIVFGKANKRNGCGGFFFRSLVFIIYIKKEVQMNGGVIAIGSSKKRTNLWL